MMDPVGSDKLNKYDRARSIANSHQVIIVKIIKVTCPEF